MKNNIQNLVRAFNSKFLAHREPQRINQLRATEDYFIIDFSDSVVINFNKFISTLPHSRGSTLKFLLPSSLWLSVAHFPN
jgi:hypothetical protein